MRMGVLVGLSYISSHFSTYITPRPFKYRHISIDFTVSISRTPSEAKAFCHLQSMDNKDDVLVDIAGVLQGKKTLEEILDETYHLQVAQPTYRRMFDVLQIM
ncbi:hypothetical protein BGZ96_004574 [Linnemannia gamsii]|uniref:Uncharacterized protein n=1 Tax=Linnemannia gamsii TaxID=64522 RepID=A0ABQ7JI05_9FUNG|nr:hypothetical protein BGZ96_004574 [Linnemannia gamsii]